MKNCEAIFVLKKELDGIPSDIDKSAFEKAVELAIKALEDRPQGEWILNKDEDPECPFCHHSFTFWNNFCGNCGADMRVKGGRQ